MTRAGANRAGGLAQGAAIVQHPAPEEGKGEGLSSPGGNGLAYRPVIFDLDGTLPDSADWFISMTHEVPRQFPSRQITDTEIALPRGRSSRQATPYIPHPAGKMTFHPRHLPRP